MPVRSPRPFGQVVDRFQIDQGDLRHVDADQPGERHHREFVFGDAAKARRGQFDDPRAADAFGRDGQALVRPGIAERREFELHAGQRKAQRVFADVVIAFDFFIRAGRPGFAVGRLDGQRAGQVAAQHPEQEEFS